MDRNDSHIFLLYIEPCKEEKSTKPINDEYSELMEFVLYKAKEGCAAYSHEHEPSAKGEDLFTEGCGYKGWHSTECGKISTNKDYLLENGMITNSLAPFYVAWYRNSIPKEQWKMIEELKEFYG